MRSAFTRVIRIATRRESDGSGEARVVVEDNFHHFRVVILHDGIRVTGTANESRRGPFSLCGAAGGRLRELVGMPLSVYVTSVFRHTNARLQCTHQFDIAAVAVAVAARDIAERRYDLMIPDYIDGRTSAGLSRDGSEILRWELDGETIVAPDLFAGRTIGSGFTGWVDKTLNDEQAEAALILRRGAFIAWGNYPITPVHAHAPLTGGCWVQQPERYEQAFEIVGSHQDFSGRVHLLTADDDDWLRFAEAMDSQVH